MTVAVQDRAPAVPAQPQGEIAGPVVERDELEDCADITTVTLRITKDTKARLQRLARARGDRYTRLLREWIELELTNAENQDNVVTREQALRAVQALQDMGLVA